MADDGDTAKDDAVNDDAVDGEPESTGAPETEHASALSRAAEMGPLPGIHDEEEAEDAESNLPPVGQRLGDERAETIGFRGLR
jgi:hypothetical protein